MQMCKYVVDGNLNVSGECRENETGELSTKLMTDTNCQ